MAQNIQQNDAAGGAGSIWGGLLGVAVNGLSRAVDGALSKKYPLTSQNETVTVDAFGNILPKGAPQASTSAGASALGVLGSPVGVAGIMLLIGVGITVLIVKASK